MNRRKFIKMGALFVPASIGYGQSLATRRIAAPTPVASTGNGLLNNLVAYYKFDEASGDAVDASGAGLTLTQVGTLGIGTGLLNGCRSGSGSAQNFKSTAAAFKFADTSLTMIGFFKPGTITSGAVLIGRYDSSTANRSYNLAISGTNLTFNMSADGTTVSTINFSGLTLVVATWYFFFARYNSVSDVQELSVTPVSEGTVRASVTGSSAGGFFSTSTATFSVFSKYTGAAASQFINAAADEVGIYNRALTDAQITAYYNGGTPLGYPAFTT